MTCVASLLAHQGGWDEVLLVAGPIVAIVGLLMLAKKRVDSAAERAEAVDGPDQGETSGIETSEVQPSEVQHGPGRPGRSGSDASTT